MEEFLRYTILGLVIGGVYGIAASGLVVTYTTSGIFNFAHGATAMLGAFAYWQLRYDWGWPAPIVLVLVLGVAAPLLGALQHVVIMRGLRGTAEVTRIVVPISVMLGFLALSRWIWDPSVTRSFPRFFGASKNVSIAGINISYTEVLALILAVVIAVSLRYLFFRTRSGVAMRAVVDDPALLELNGGQPERLATMSWALGAMLAALAGILVTPISSGAMSADALTLLVINAFAAAMFGRLRSLPRTFVGGIVLGLTTNYVIAYLDDPKWTWVSNLRRSIPMILLFVVLIVLPQDRLRGTTVMRSRERFRLPSMRTAWIAAGALVVVMFLLREILQPTGINDLTFGMTMAVIALSLVLLTGYAGEINLAAVSFGAIGTVVVYHVGIRGTGFDARTNLQGYLLAAVVCGGIGALVALPALRLRGLYLALATMAFGVFVSYMVLGEISERRLPLFHNKFTIFPAGTLTMAKPKFGPLDMNSPPTFLMFVTVVFALLGVGLIAFRHSNYGRRVAALKDSPAAAATLGMNVVKLKLLVFTLSAAIAGVGGALMSAQLGAVNVDKFDIFLSLALLMLTVVGGIGYVSGALFGGVLLGVGFSALDNTLTKLGTDHVTLAGLFHFLSDFTLVLPATIGVTMAKNPSGAVHDIVTNFRAMSRARPVLIGATALEAVLYGLARAGTINNWYFLVFSFAILLLLPVVAQALMPQAFAVEGGEAAPEDELPLELVGIDRPFTLEDRDFLDRELGLHGSGRVPAGAVSEGDV